MPNLSRARDTVQLEIDLISLMSLHGAVCLALRHPEMTANKVSEVRGMLERFLDRAEGIFLNFGFLTEEEIAEVHRVERAESPHLHTDWWPGRGR